MEFLKKNALKFYKKAEESYEEGDYNFTMFFVEQTIQLILKYLISKKYGDFPKSHGLKLLFELTGDKKLMEFRERNLDILRDIELSYVASRYFDVEYSQETARRALEAVKKLMEVCGID
ncbi:MAG: HEPN domain-containing protein [Archaeoglobi archaeon]|nr:HEPN domain-containing protein [Candidatus Mnemosynella sp.]MBC7115405.1 HEPN domain-containing protein [Candidatus Mnemosynella bozhongmuii]